MHVPMVPETMPVENEKSSQSSAGILRMQMLDILLTKHQDDWERNFHSSSVNVFWCLEVIRAINIPKWLSGENDFQVKLEIPKY